MTSSVGLTPRKTPSRMAFSVAMAAAAHCIAQARPHPLEGKRPYAMRVTGRGELVAQFFLPLDLAQPRNRTRGCRQAWQWTTEREQVFMAMMVQWRASACTAVQLPIEGRPLVRCIRYSSVEPDSTAGWAKVPVDCLQPSGTRTVSKTVTGPFGRKVKLSRQVRYHGLGIIQSDSPRQTDVVESWEPAKRGEGFAVIEVWTGGNCEQ